MYSCTFLSTWHLIINCQIIPTQKVTCQKQHKQHVKLSVIGIIPPNCNYSANQKSLLISSPSCTVPLPSGLVWRPPLVSPARSDSAETGLAKMFRLFEVVRILQLPPDSYQLLLLESYQPQIISVRWTKYFCQISVKFNSSLIRNGKMHDGN